MNIEHMLNYPVRNPYLEYPFPDYGIKRFHEAYNNKGDFNNAEKEPERKVIHNDGEENDDSAPVTSRDQDQQVLVDDTAEARNNNRHKDDVKFDAHDDSQRQIASEKNSHTSQFTVDVSSSGQ